MNSDPEPLPEAYSRVTNPERFGPLHHAVDSLIDDLLRRYDVERLDNAGRCDLSPGPRHHIIRAVTLKPRAADAASIEIWFTSFPGVFVRTGAGTTLAFPPCGCDACAETAETEIDRLRWTLDNVVRGSFIEEVRAGRFGYQFGSAGSDQTKAWTTLSDVDPRNELAIKTYDWRPWPARA